MKHDVYFSAKLAHRPLAFALAHSAYWNLKSSWHLAEKQTEGPELRAMWDKYLDEIAESKVFLMYVEPGYKYKGCIVEAGVALACGKTVIIWYNGFNCSDPWPPKEALAGVLGTWVYHKNVQAHEFKVGLL